MQRLKINKNGVFVFLFLLFGCGEHTEKNISLEKPISFFNFTEVYLNLALNTSPLLKFTINGNSAFNIIEFSLRADCFNEFTKVEHEFTEKPFTFFYDKNLLIEEKREISWNLHSFFDVNKIILKIETIKIDNFEKFKCDTAEQDCQITAVCLKSVRDSCYIPSSYEF